MIATLASRQHGLVALWQLVSRGVSARALRRRVRSGRLFEIHPGVFAVGHARLTEAARLLAAALAYGEQGTVGFRSAAAYRALLKDEDRAVPVAVIAPTGRQRVGTRLHRLTLRPGDRRWRDGVPVTTVGRTLADLATAVPTPLLEKAVHEAQVLQLLTPSEIRRAATASTHRPGGAHLRHLLSQVDPEQRVRSHLERRFLELVRQSRMPKPKTNHLVEIEGTLHEIDCAWPDLKIAVELDGAALHATPKARERDARRDARFARAGWETRRFGTDDLTSGAAAAWLSRP